MFHPGVQDNPGVAFKGPARTYGAEPGTSFTFAQDRAHLIPATGGAEANTPLTLAASAVEADPTVLRVPEPSGRSLPRHRSARRLQPPKQKGATRKLAIADKRQAIFFSRSLIEAFQCAADYDQIRNHNQGKPPVLWIDDERYLIDVREIAADLRAAIPLLETAQKRHVKAGPFRKLAAHFDKFLAAYATKLGHDLAALTAGTIAAWGLQLGIVPSEITLFIGKSNH